MLTWQDYLQVVIGTTYVVGLAFYAVMHAPAGCLF